MHCSASRDMPLPTFSRPPALPACCRCPLGWIAWQHTSRLILCCLLQVRTQTLVKNAIVQIDATPFKQWYSQHYGLEVGLKKKLGAANVPGTEAQVSHTCTTEQLVFRGLGSLCCMLVLEQAVQA